MRSSFIRCVFHVLSDAETVDEALAMWQMPSIAPRMRAELPARPEVYPAVHVSNFCRRLRVFLPWWGEDLRA